MKAYRFIHLNVHSHYSIMDGCASIRELVDAAIKDKMPGIDSTMAFLEENTYLAPLE